MYWLDHAEPEDENEADSYSNSHEAEMIRGLVKYLISQNQYGVGDIAILVRRSLLLYTSIWSNME